MAEWLGRMSAVLYPDCMISPIRGCFTGFRVQVSDTSKAHNRAIRVANDRIYGLNASVFTNDVDRAREVARQLRSGTVGPSPAHQPIPYSLPGFIQWRPHASGP
jgi:hypothetical protein